MAVRPPSVPAAPRRRPRVFLVLGPVLALACVLACDAVRARHIALTTALPGRASAAPDTRSPTGFSGGQRELVVPEGDEIAFAAIERAQAALAGQSLRSHWTLSENAPFGHRTRPSLPLDAWLLLVAEVARGITGQPAGRGVDTAAVWSGPVLQLVVIGAAFALAGLRLGIVGSALAAVGSCLLFPFAVSFLPGLPGPRGMSAAWALLSLLLTAGGCVSGRRRDWAGAGIAGALAVWTLPSAALPLFAGVVAGALALGRSQEARAAGLNGSWRVWGYSGGATLLAAAVIEYVPGDVTAMRLDAVHPVYALSWVGAGEVLAAAWALRDGGARTFGKQGWIRAAFGFTALVAAPLAAGLSGTPVILGTQADASRIALLPGVPAAASTAGLIGHGGAGLCQLALVLAVAGGAAAALALLQARGRERVGGALLSGAALASAACAWREPGAWAEEEAALIALLALCGAAQSCPAWARRGALVVGAAAALAGLGAAVPREGPAPSPRESEELVQRHLAHWLARRAPDSVVLAPPRQTPGLIYFGSLRGVGTFSPENEPGLGAALTLVSEPTMEQAGAQVQARGIRFVVLPTWDRFLDAPALRGVQRPSLFIGELRHWHLPPWLRAIPYQMPVSGAFEGQSVAVFEVVDEQRPAVAAGRLAEYLVETGNLDAAGVQVPTLRHFPGDVGALTALALVAFARGDREEFAAAAGQVEARLGAGADRYLPWDRRVSLALVLAQANREKETRAQVLRCLNEATEERLRFLTTGSLFNLLLLQKILGLSFPHEGLAGYARELLPEELRQRLDAP